MHTSHPVVLVTGGSGFLGRALITELLKEEADGGVLLPREIRVFDPEPCVHESHERVTGIRGDIRSAEALREAVQGVDLVFHSAALVDWGRYPDSVLEAVNVEGTRNVIEACRTAAVGALVHTSSLDVIYTGKPIRDGDESLPYPGRFVNAYCRTKAEGEQLALAANGTPLDGAGGHTLRTVVMRPSCIWGEGDPYHVGSLVRMARSGMLMRIGNGTSRSQHVYVRNAAHAHVLAGKALLQPDSAAAGQVYFITDHPAHNFFDHHAPILEALGLRVPSKKLSLPRSLMYGVGMINEAAAALARPVARLTPTITRFAVDFVCLEMTLSGEKAARDLGYAPIYSEEEAYARTIAHFREHEEG